MRTLLLRTLASAAALASASQAFAQISLEKEVIMINGTATPVLNGPLGNFVGNTNQSGTPPAQPDGTVGQLPPEDFAKTPLITPALEKSNMDAITVPEGFEAKVFATPPIVNYPTTVAAARDGSMVFVAVDGNGAQSAWSHLGRVIRLKDTNHDGVADEATAFIPDVDNPRGLLWDHDHLIVLAPPTISAYYDRNGDGVADEKKVLINNFGRTIADARVDHGQNSIELGIDGWIYIALGDQGVNGATSTVDGRKLTMRGGGVIRIRPDGSGMEIWAHNTRNIFGTAVSPTLEVFARDNTNDGGGWNVRFHHLSGMTDQGYPSLFTNFPDEVVTPLADFGGGSGSGGMWLDEPGIPAQWNDLPYTADYGQRAIFAHHVQPKGATFTLPGYGVTDSSINGVPLRLPGQEVAAGNQPFIEFPNPMDPDVDGNSVIYATHWSGGFSWAGRNQGAVYSIRPKGFTPAPMPNFDTATAAELVQVLAGNSNMRRIEAQRAILRRSAQMGQGIDAQLLALANDKTKSLNNRTAALFTYKQLRGAASTQAITAMVADPTIAALALRALGDDLAQARSIPIATVTAQLKSTDPRTRKEALITLARADSKASAPLIVPLMGDSDPIVAHTAIQVLRSFRSVDQALAAVDNATSPAAVRKGALEVLHSIHDPKVTDALIQRLKDDQPVAKRQDIVAALSRLSNTETAWNGTWWATRPDNTGPYFAPAPWAETAKIQTALGAVLDRAGPEEVLAMGRTYMKEGVSAGPAVAKFLSYADSEPALIPQITSYFATADTIPSNALPVLTKVASAPGTVPAVRAQAITALTKTNDRTSWAAVLPAVKLLNAPAAAAGGRGGAPAGGGRGGAAAPPAPAIPNATQLQTLLVTGMDTTTAPQLQAVAAARTALAAASLSAPDAIPARAAAVAQAEQALATARADAFAKIQVSVAKFNPQQASALAAQQAIAAPPAAAAGGRGGGGGRGGAAVVTPVQQAQQAVVNTPRIDEIYPVLIEEAAKLDGETSQLADAALITLAGRRFGVAASHDAAVKAIDTGWTDPRRRAQIIMAAVTARDTSHAPQIIAAMNDSDAAVARAAQYAVQQLAIDPAGLAAAATQPKIGGMSVAATLDAVVPAKGTIVRGQQLSRELGCIACHTFNSSDAPKGPDLSKISSILQRRELAEAILDPNKSISQGFSTVVIELKNGTSFSGFVVSEGGGSVTVRNIETQQKFATTDIAKRTSVETSFMPPGLTAGLTVTEFASLLDYIESLSKP